MFVTKFDGRREPFYKSKVLKTCMRMGATYSQAKAVADKVESKAYDGIPTRQILSLIFEYMEKYKPSVAHQIDLREAISLLRPKPDFEKFVGLLLASEGYEVKNNLILLGKCVDHEIDAIATKGGETLYVEVKHHFNHHTYTGLDVILQANSAFEDLKEGYKLGKHSINFTKALIVCNTKLSEHAKAYAACRGIECIGWKYPTDTGLEQMIEKRKLYPITYIKGLDRKMREKLADAGIITLKQLLEAGIDRLTAITKVSAKVLGPIVSNAEEILR